MRFSPTTCARALLTAGVASTMVMAHAWAGAPAGHGKGTAPIRGKGNPVFTVVAPPLPQAAAGSSGPESGAPAVAPHPAITFLHPQALVAEAPGVASLEIPGNLGKFRVPYIQSQPALEIALSVTGLSPDDSVQASLDPGTPAEIQVVLDSPAADGVFRGTIADLPLGEHTLEAYVLRPREGSPSALAAADRPVAAATLTQVARGDIIAALGDSTTEGLGDASLRAFPDWVRATAAARAAGAHWVTPDGRNYPQSVARTAGVSMASFTVELGRILSQQRGHPVLVLNEGWSGITADGYTHVITSNVLQAVFGAARPSEWVINLGVNDALVRRPAPEYQVRMQEIINAIEGGFAGASTSIHLACPSYARQPERHRLEQTYMPALQALRVNGNLGGGPDFFSLYRDHPELLADQVHPNSQGYNEMASQWAGVMLGSMPSAGCS
jgi:lysophospholipase L1-like esterase